MQTARVLKLISLIDRLNRMVFNAVCWLTLIMVLVGAFNAVARFLGKSIGTNLTSNAWVEAQWYLFSIVFLFAAPWALHLGAHVRVDVIYDRLNERRQAWIDLVGGLVFLIPFCIFALLFTLPSVKASLVIWEVSPDPHGLPRWPIKSAVPIAFLLLLLQGIAEISRRYLFLFKGIALKDPANPIEASATIKAQEPQP